MQISFTRMRHEDDVEGVSSCAIKLYDGRVVIKHDKAEDIFAVRMNAYDRLLLEGMHVRL